MKISLYPTLGVFLFALALQSSTSSTDIRQNCPYCPDIVLVKGGNLRISGTDEVLNIADYYIGKYEVTQAQWMAIMDNNPSLHAGCEQCPVEQVSWHDAQEYLRRLNKKSGKSYRLPTEAEWEYAAKGGKLARNLRYAGSNNLDEVAWYSDNAEGNSHPVGEKRANELGLHDMSGNVWEWCLDQYRAKANTNLGMLRGGAWTSWEGYCTPQFQNSYYSKQHGCETDGFRVAHPALIDL